MILGQLVLLGQPVPGVSAVRDVEGRASRWWRSGQLDALRQRSLPLGRLCCRAASGARAAGRPCAPVRLALGNLGSV